MTIKKIRDDASTTSTLTQSSVCSHCHHESVATPWIKPEIIFLSALGTFGISALIWAVSSSHDAPAGVNSVNAGQINSEAAAPQSEMERLFAQAGAMAVPVRPRIRMPLKTVTQTGQPRKQLAMHVPLSGGSNGQPGVAGSQSAALKSEPNVIKSEAVAVKSQPAAVRSEAVAMKSESAAMKSESAAMKSESAAMKSESAAMKSESAVMKSESAARKSESAATKSESAAVKSEPAAKESQAAPMKSDAATTKSESTQTKSEKAVGDVAEYNRSLAGFFEKRKSTAPDTVDGADQSTPVEPPTYEEWLKAGKPSF